ncbi:MAG: hypothetical protein FWH22_07825 [Fibromonadales bacterium]|nr:hypothetical protein [Fibromonadales bacterium]
MKNSCSLFIILIMLISCTDVDKFSDAESFKLIIENEITYQVVGNELRLEGNIDQIEYYINDYFWIVNEDTIRSIIRPRIAINYGEYFVKLILIDFYGDTISDSLLIRHNESLEVELLSPIDGFLDCSETLEFSYRISGVDSWEEAEALVYVSADENSLWQEKNIWQNSVDNVCFWGVKAWTEQDTALSSIRRLCNCEGIK